MWLPDGTIEHLRGVADEPDLSGTRYRLADLIGRGGMGRVYRARDSELDRDVALKVIHTSEAGAADRLLAEAKILARLEHPGIVPVHDAGTLPDGRVFCAMKLVRGKRLDALAREAITLPERLRIFQRIGETVAFAHAHGVLHRDLKPQNIMVGAFGEVLVLDWGIAKETRIMSDATATADESAAANRNTPESTELGTRIGTPGWMAPEQEQGLTDRISERTDVYGLGAILRLLLETAPVEETRKPPARLRAIVERATAPDPGERYPDVQSMTADVARFLGGLPVSAYHEPFFERATRILRKYRTPILLVLTYLVMRILFIVFSDS